MANIKDVAREAGVSVATVSRVFSGAAPVAEATARRVREVAARLDYVPDAAARSLITGRTNALGVVLPELHGEFFTEVIRGIDRAARSQGMHLLVSSANADAESFEAALRSMRGRIDGLVLMTPDSVTSAAAERFRAQVPVMLLNPATAAGNCDCITFDNVGGAMLMIRHLLSLGHTRIATISGPLTNVDANQRLEGYRLAMAEAGVADSALEFWGDFISQASHRARHIKTNLVNNFRNRTTSKRGAPGEEGIEDSPKAIDVRPRGCGFSFGLLGRHEVSGSNDPPAHGQVRRSEEFGDTKVSELNATFVCYQQVGWLDVAMDNAMIVGLFERAGDLQSDLYRFLPREFLPGGQFPLQAVAWHQFHGIKQVTVLFAISKHLHDMRMPQPF